MRQYIWTVAVLVVFCNIAESRSLVKRETAGAHHEYDVKLRDKAKVEAAYGIKNALLGFVFNKINSFIDQKTAWVDHLDRTNIAKNKAQGIYPPKDPVLQLSHVLSGKIGEKLQAAGPWITAVTNKLTSGSSSLAGGHTGGFNFGVLPGASGHASAGFTAGYGA